MKVYFLDETKTVLLSDGETVKIYDCAPAGFYEGVDVCRKSAPENLRKHFENLIANGNLNSYDDIFSKNEMPVTDEIIEVLDKAQFIIDTDNAAMPEAENYITAPIPPENPQEIPPKFTPEDPPENETYVVVKNQWDRINRKFIETVIYSGSRAECVQTEEAERRRIKDRTVCDVFTERLDRYRSYKG